MTITRSLLFLVIAIVCMVLALIVALGGNVFDGNWQDWAAGSLISYYLSHLP